MEMCVQNLYPRRSPELPGNSRKALLELRATKERLRCESFPIPAVFRPTNPFFRRRFVPARVTDQGHVSRFAGAGKRGNEFPQENAGVMDTSTRYLAFHRGRTTPADIHFAFYFNSTSRNFIVRRGLRHAVSSIFHAEYLTCDELKHSASKKRLILLEM